MRILITGVTGFAGGTLAEECLARPGVTVVGLDRRAAWPPMWAGLDGRVELRGCDLADAAATEALLRDVRPDAVYHVAGYPHVGRSFQEPDAAWAGNLGVTRNLYEAVVRWGGRPRVLFVGSGLIYAHDRNDGRVHDEDSLLLPTSPYASSKAAADLMSYQFTRNPGLDIVRARPLNHIGPRQAPDFAVANFARQLVAIERGTRPPELATGNLSPRRDMTDVRDVARAYLLLGEKGRTGEAYNVCSGHVVTMREVLDRLVALAGVPVRVTTDPALVRATEVEVVQADAGKLRRETGWAPSYSWEQSLRDTLDYWRGQP